MPENAIFAELLRWNEYTKIFIAVFALVSPSVIVPMFLAVIGERVRGEKIGAACVGALGFAVVTITFTFFGPAVLAVFDISTGAFKFVGGVLIAVLAVDIMRTDNSAASAQLREADAGWLSIGLAPLAIPILAGPGTISAVVIFASEHDTIGHKALMTVILLAVSVSIAAILSFATMTNRRFGPIFTAVTNRTMGLIILAVAIEFILDGIAEHFPILKTIHQSAGP